MKKLYTSKGIGISVSESDYLLAQSYVWCLDGHGYPCTNTQHGMLYLHQMLMGNPPMKGFSVDHIDRDPLNNTRENLRWASQTLQNINQRLRCDNTSGIKGVRLHRQWGWQARIQLFGKSIHLGWFSTFEDAVEARRQGEERYHKPLEKVTG